MMTPHTSVTNPITYKIGFDNAGGITLAVPEHKWSLYLLGNETHAAQIILDIDEGADPDSCWDNQWDEGVQDDLGERQITAHDLYDLAFQLLSDPTGGKTECAFRAAVVELTPVRKILRHGRLRGQRACEATSEAATRPDAWVYSPEIRACYVTAITSQRICRALGFPADDWPLIRHLWAVGFQQGYSQTHAQLSKHHRFNSNKPRGQH